MEVILMERIAKLGQMGNIVRVKDGYARNYLIPRGKAVRATAQAKKDFDSRRQELEARNIELKSESEKLKVDVEGKSVIILRQASETASLYGSVSARDIAAAFSESGVLLDRQQVVLDHPIKELGIHDVTIALHPEVECTVVVNVARTQEEAEIQAGTRQAVVEEELVNAEELEPSIVDELFESPEEQDIT
jgi:large subunit ribosomal protein L9